MNKLFKSSLIRGEVLIGPIVTLSSTEVAEIFSQSGFDWLFIDLEHGAIDIKHAQLIIQVVSPKTPCLVRVPSNDEIWIKKALDIGSSGIIVPQIRTADDALRAVQYCKYPPEGTRSVGIARAQKYGDRFTEYVESANSEITLVVQIEHIEAVENIEDILEVPGVDCLFVGPYDLSASMDKTGLINDKDVQNAILHVKKCAEKAEIPLGIFGATAEVVKTYIQSGYTLIAVSTDTMLLVEASKNILNSLK